MASELNHHDTPDMQYQYCSTNNISTLKEIVIALFAQYCWTKNTTKKLNQVESKRNRDMLYSLMLCLFGKLRFERNHQNFNFSYRQFCPRKRSEAYKIQRLNSLVTGSTYALLKLQWTYRKSTLLVRLFRRKEPVKGTNCYLTKFFEKDIWVPARFYR